MGDAVELREAEDTRIALTHALTHTSWRPLSSEAADVLVHKPALRCMYDLATETYWELFATAPGWPPCTPFAALALMQRVLLAEAQGKGKQKREGEGDIMDHIAPACLWIATKVVEGQEACASAECFCADWNTVARVRIYSRDLRRAEVEVLNALQHDVTQPTTYDMCVMCLRLAAGVSQPTKEAALRDMTNLLIVVEKMPEALRFAPAHMCLALCASCHIPVDDTWASLVDASAVQAARAFIHTFDRE
jgi:hypothetical protein